MITRHFIGSKVLATGIAATVVVFAVFWAGSNGDSVRTRSAALATSEYWSAAASSGAIDENDLEIASTSGAALALVSDAPASSVLRARYNITHVDGIDDFPCAALEVRYRDNGAGARVLARLKATSRHTGETTTILTFDSDSFPVQSGFQRQVATNCGPGVVFGFSTHSYFLEVELRKITGNGNPGFASAGIVTFDG